METQTHVEKYLNEISQWNPLPASQERKLASVIRKDKDQQLKQKAREELMQCNLRLVVAIAYEYARHTDMPIMDIIQAGNIGLAKAVDRFNPRKYKTKFSTYCTHWIKQSIRRAMTSYHQHVHVPSNISLQVSQYVKLVRQSEESGRPLTDFECMKKMKITADTLKKIQESKLYVVSMDQNCIMEDSSSYTYAEMIADNNAVLPYESFASQDLSERMEKALSELDEQSREIVVCQCMQDNKVNLRDLGKKYGLSGERIRQIKNEALCNLKRIIERNHSIGSNHDQKRKAKGLSIHY